MRILLVEDVEVVREALAALLNSHPDLHVVAQLGRGDVIVPVAVRSQPDVAVIDADLAGVDGLSAAILLHQQYPGCPTLILSGVDKPAAGDSADAGVSGLLLHAAPAADLAGAVRTVADRGRSRAAASAVVAQAAAHALAAAPCQGGAATAGGPPPVDDPVQANGGAPAPSCPLSPRELEVLRRTAHGESVRDIAEVLRLAEGTVRNHLTAIGTKLRARTRVDSVRIAQMAGWIPA
ncbi:response regulator transcription factor [Dactylosporangium sp. NPDC049525]|uniref:response regulator transcription factor n=1 Tax=Dactylosporangium sp. NPDC049525 TaxID=3154730 RepID=UPI00343E109E